MRQPLTKTKPRKSTLASFPVPTAGLISNRNLAIPDSAQMPPGAEVLRNWFPTPKTIRLRRGLRRWATLPNGLPVRSLFTYSIGQLQQMFAATDEGIWNITTVSEPFPAIVSPGPDEGIGTENNEFIGWGSVDGLDVLTGTTNGDWVTVQYSTAGATFLIGVNGVDQGWIYDGSEFWPYVPGGVSEIGIASINAFEAGEDVFGPARQEYRLESVTGTFEVGETLTGGTSGATAVIRRIIGVDVVVELASMDFTLGEEVTGGTSGATADVFSGPADQTFSAEVYREGSGFLYVVNVQGLLYAGDAITGSVAGDATVDQAPAVVAPGVTGIASDRMSYVWTYKNRVWFIERDTLNAWYLPVDQVGGQATVFPMGGIFPHGGSLLWGQTWSLDTSGEGGLSAQNVFVTTEGEVASYQGLSPDDANTWSIVGVYRIGKPMGKKAWIRAGGDLIIATNLGMIPLGRAIQADYAGLGLIAVSNPISDQWVEALEVRGSDNWVCQLWGEGQMMLVAPPVPLDADPMLLVANSDSGAWTIFDNWQPTAMTTFRGQLFIGSTGGRVQRAWVGGNDDGLPYTGVCTPLFNDLGAPGQRKIAKVARVVKKSAYLSPERVDARFDWDMEIPAAPDAPELPAASVWDAGIWDQSIWNAGRGTVISETWHSVGGTGYSSSVVLQATSGGDLPLDIEVIRIDYSYTVADIIS